MLKCGGLIRAVCFEREIRVYLCLKMHKNIKWQMTFEEEALLLHLKADHLAHHLQCPATQVAMHKSLQVTWRNRTPKYRTPKLGEKDLILLQNLLKSRNFHNSSSSCCYSLLVRISVFRRPGVSLGEAKPFSRHWNHHGPLLILETQVPRLSKGTSEFQQVSRASAASSPSLRNMIYVRVMRH